MVILEVCEVVSFYGGNFIECLKSLDKHIRNSGDNNRMLYAFPIEAKEIDWVKALGSAGSVFYFNRRRPQYMLDLLNLCSKNHVDIVHLHFCGVINTLLLQLFTHVKIVAHFHNTIDPLPLYKRCIYKLGSYRVSKFIGCSHYVMETMLDNGFAKEKCMFVTNCIDFKRLDVVHNPHVLSNGKTNMLIFGTDFYRKGVDLVLKALSPIAEKYNLCLQIITHNPKSAEEDVVNVMGFFPNWCEIKPPVNNIADYYRASVAFLSPSREEGFCTAALEALYCGCFVVKSDFPAMIHHLQNEDKLICKLDVDDIQRHIEEVVKMNSATRFEFLLLIKKQISEKYSCDKWASEVYNVYKSLI